MNILLQQIRFSHPIKINNRNEILKLKLKNEDRFLIKNQNPLAAIWRGNNESSCFYAWIASTSKNIIESKELEEMNHFLQDNIDQNRALKDVISPLLKIVESGWYQLFYHNPYQTNKVNTNNNENLSLSYPSRYKIWNETIHNDKKSDVWIDGTIVFTQDLKKLDQKRVEHYKNSIQSGKRPTIVTMTLAELEFYRTEDFLENLNANEQALLALEYGSDSIYPQLIIDGHHKAKAYIELNKRPSIINLTKLQLKEEFENNDWNYNEVKKIIEDNIGEKLYYV